MPIPFVNLSRASFIAAVCLLAFAALKNRARTVAFLRDFFLKPASPVNLAIFRIVTFYYVYRRAKVLDLAYYLSIPQELRVPPAGYESWFHLIPLDLTFAQTAQSLLVIVSMLACLGLLTRLTSWLTVILTWYIFLLPIIFGKINHTNHHMFWFVMVLAASPCHHALSFDAIFASLRKKTPKKITSLTDHSVYTLPLRVIWILLSIVYFFPGFWKLWETGWYWAFSDNLINQMHLNWHLRSIEPPFRVDHFPLLVQGGAFVVMLFEITAPLLILTPPGRTIFILSGLFFHKASQWFLGINFKVLYSYYFVLIDWRHWLHLLGKHLYRRKAPMYCFPSDPVSCRILGLCRAFDLFSLIQVKYPDRGASVAAEDNVVFCSHETWKDFKTASNILILTPVVLCLWPLLKPRLLKLNEPCKDTPDSIVRFSKTFILTSAFLIISGIYCGFMSKNSWPFAQYPTFKFYAIPTHTTLEIEAVLSNGSVQAFTTADLKDFLPASFLKPLENAVLYENDREKAAGIINGLQKSKRELRQAVRFRFYRLKKDLDPDRTDGGIRAKDLLFEITPVQPDTAS